MVVLLQTYMSMVCSDPTWTPLLLPGFEEHYYTRFGNWTYFYLFRRPTCRQ